LACSVFVAGSAVALRSFQQQNATLDKQKNVLAVAGLVEPGQRLSAKDVEDRFRESIRPRLVDLKTGAYATDEEKTLDTYDPEKTPSEPAPPNKARVMQLPEYTLVYQVVKDDKVERVILPVHGKGLWSTLYGLLAMDADGKTIRGITFYEHAETPGLGGEVDNPKWKAKWDGRQAVDEKGTAVICVVKGTADQPYEVDGLSGATLTSRGVTNLVQFWLGENGFGPYLATIRNKRE